VKCHKRHHVFVASYTLLAFNRKWFITDFEASAFVLCNNPKMGLQAFIKEIVLTKTGETSIVKLDDGFLENELLVFLLLFYQCMFIY
jgi:hypothetical protein